MAHLPPTTRPPRGLSKPWALPTPAFATWQGAGDAYGLTPAPQPQIVGSPPTSKGCCRYAVASQALTGFLLRPLRDSFATPKEMERGHGDAVVHFTLDALNRPNTQPRGMWIGFATCPCGLASESGVWGKAPRSLQIRPNNVI